NVKTWKNFGKCDQAARTYLAVSATSTPSERLFSDCEKDKIHEIVGSEYKGLDIDEELKKLLNNDKYKLTWIRYEFKNVKLIGRGGFATVFSAIWERKLNEYVPFESIQFYNDLIKSYYDEEIPENISGSDELSEILKKYSSRFSELNRSQPINIDYEYKDEDLDLQIL
ncbi:8156_t:CDS:2, partial [Racocetra fulgida]